MKNRNNIVSVMAGLALLALMGVGLAGVLQNATSSRGPAAAQTPQGYPPAQATASGPLLAPGNTPIGYPPPPTLSPVVPTSMPQNTVVIVYANQSPTPWQTFTPPPQPTRRPGPTETPLPLLLPAQSPKGVIVYTASSQPSTAGGPGSLTLFSLTVDENAQTQSLPTAINTTPLRGDDMYLSNNTNRAAIVTGVESGEVVDILNIATGQVHPLLNSSHQSSGMFLGWHPDGRHVLFVATTGGPDSGLWLVDADIGDLTVLYRDPEGASAITDGAVSPDGQQVIYSFYRGIGSQAELRLIDADGSNPHVLLSSQSDIGLIAWSPDGSKVAFLGEKGFTILDLPSGTIHAFPIQIGGDYRWSPDSHVIAYVTPDNTTNQKTLPSDPFRGRTIRLLDTTTGSDRLLLTDAVAGNIDPAWSPDGSRLVFVSNRSGSPHLWMVHPDGTGLSQLTHGNQYVRFPLWLAFQP